MDITNPHGHHKSAWTWLVENKGDPKKAKTQKTKKQTHSGWGRYGVKAYGVRALERPELAPYSRRCAAMEECNSGNKNNNNNNNNSNKQ